MKKPKILVVGSFVKDLIVSTRVFPKAGETVLGTDFHMATGGKGANQAIQAARLGADVTMVGRVGADPFGEELVEACRVNGIDCSRIQTDPNAPSSIGNVQLQMEEDGSTQNRIIVVPGANMAITPADVEFLKEAMQEYDMVMLQLEIPLEINILVAQLARQYGVPVMLNTAPSDKTISEELLSCVTYLSCNEFEAFDLTGMSINPVGGSVDLEEVKAVIQALLGRGIEHVLVTLGKAGAAFGNKDGSFVIPTLQDVHSVDPTGAGDAFIGAFCTYVSMGIDYRTAVRMANYIGAITVSTMGAQTSFPSLRELNDRIRERGETDLLLLAEAK